MTKSSSAPTDRQSLRADRRRIREDVSRAQLLDVAEAVFGRKGFHDATLKEIAEQAEFSVGSVYSFFESKEDLLCRIFERRGQESMEGIRKAFGSAGTPMQRLHRIADFEIEFFRRYPHFGRLSLRYLNADVLVLEGGIRQQTIVENYAEQAGVPNPDELA